MSLIQCCCASGCTFTMTVNGCGFLVGAGQSITVTQGMTTIGTYTTNSSGQFTFPGSNGTYTFTGSRTRFTALNTTLTLNCASPTGGLTFFAATGYHCAVLCAYPLADTLNVSLVGFPVISAGCVRGPIYATLAIVYNFTNFRWEGTVVVSGMTWLVTYNGGLNMTVNGDGSFAFITFGACFPVGCPLGAVLYNFLAALNGGAFFTE